MLGAVALTTNDASGTSETKPTNPLMLLPALVVVSVRPLTSVALIVSASVASSPRMLVPKTLAPTALTGLAKLLRVSVSAYHCVVIAMLPATGATYRPEGELTVSVLRLDELRA